MCGAGHVGSLLSPANARGTEGIGAANVHAVHLGDSEPMLVVLDGGSGVEEETGKDVDSADCLVGVQTACAAVKDSHL